MVLFWSKRPGQNRTKIGRIRYLTNFVSIMFDLQLEPGEIEKNS